MSLPESSLRPCPSRLQVILQVMLPLVFFTVLLLSSIDACSVPMKMVKQPRTETYQYTKPIGPPAPLKPLRMLDVKATGYSNWEACHRCTDYRHGLTASGTVARYGTCAVDPTVLPRGTVLFVPGYGPCWGTDTGRAVKGQIIDLYFNTEQEAIAWGAPIVRVKVLGWVKPEVIR